MRTQTFEVLRAPLGAVYTVGPESWTPPGLHNQLPVWIFFYFLLRLGCRAAPGGGKAAAAAGGVEDGLYVDSGQGAGTEA